MSAKRYAPKCTWNRAQKFWATVTCLWPGTRPLWRGTAYDLEHSSGYLSRELKSAEWAPYAGQFGRFLAILARSKLCAVINSRTATERQWTLAQTPEVYFSFLKKRHPWQRGRDDARVTEIRRSFRRRFPYVE
jgi:hypothetical protein